MKPIVPLLCLMIAAGPALAEGAPGQDAAPTPGQAEGQVPKYTQKGDVSKGFDLMQEGTKLMLRGLTAQMEPKMRAMMATLVQLMGDLSAYEAPQVLPNGDILIRRKVPLVPVPPGDEGNETEL